MRTMPRFHTPLIEPDRRSSCIRLSEKGSRVRPGKTAGPRCAVVRAVHTGEQKQERDQSQKTLALIASMEEISYDLATLTEEG